MEFIDLHIHLQDYTDDFATDIVKKAQKSGLKKIVCAGTSPDDWKKVADLTEQYPDFVIPAFGLHPWYIDRAGEMWRDSLENYMQNFPCALVGETGIDGLKPDVFLQKEYFKFHIKSAQIFNRPLIIHAVKSFAQFDDLWNLLPEKFMFHSFNAHLEQLKQILRYGGYVSFGNSILKNKNFEQIIISTPKEKILCESDGPYQPLQKGEISTPFQITDLIRRIAEIRNDTVEYTAYQIYCNSLEFINVR